MTLYSWIRKREAGFRPQIGGYDTIYRTLYNAVLPFEKEGSPNPQQIKTFERSEFGGVFNLEFNDGSIMVAACEKKAIQLFDPITTERIHTIRNAHDDCVNCAKFLDNRMFATCSDDSTVALWDTRNLKQKIRCLQGHSNWVKNIEYSQQDCLLVTSGFDGSIFTWDINSYTESGLIYQKVFHTPGLMRCRLSRDATKLAICTTSGYLIIIHDLDLFTLAKDLNGFKPNVYRLMQLRRQFIPNAAKFDYAFSKKQKRNRVELVSDFPQGNDAEVVSSLHIHPQGWCALTRNISYDESTEWTCVHDIQDLPSTENETNEEDDRREILPVELPNPLLEDLRRTPPPQRPAANIVDDFPNESQQQSRRSNVPRVIVEPPAPSSTNDAQQSNNNQQSSINSNNNISRRRRRSEDDEEENDVEDLGQVEDTRSTNNAGNNAYLDIWAAAISIQHRTLRNSSNARKIPQLPIAQNKPRLMYYIEEPSKGKGFIKELCFSSDGRIICSPYDQGIRLLSFTSECQELSSIVNPFESCVPRELHQIKITECHPDIVVSTKFNPRYPSVVSGCLSGKIVWHRPQF
ncbi:DDB1- and CUL4-associated factor 10 homolog isoform X2 [Culicoides brevitarsis]|uniref:DDB1- and CUL4-associated factor 10 homolog isoform X2 n=1 Tax=Culicoides brevitarsis TaxID=469753 RepID=UPI00307B22C9